MKPYLELTTAGQFRRLRPAALDACGQFGIEPVGMRPLNHGENTTFRVTDTTGARSTVRIHRPGYQSRSSINSELTFLRDLSERTRINAPVPRRTASGESIVEVRANGVEGTRLAAAFGWIEGRLVDERIAAKHLVATGELTATLHNFAEGYNFPKDFERLSWNDPIVFPDGLARRLQKTVKPVPFFKAHEAVMKRIASYGKENDFGLIHADLHFGNVFFSGSGIAVIDFDDLGWAHHAYDYAVTLSQFRRKENFEQLRNAYEEDYCKVRSLPKDWMGRLEVFMAARVLMTTEWLFSREDNPGLRRWRDEMLPRWQVDLEKYVATGSLR